MHYNFGMIVVLKYQRMAKKAIKFTWEILLPNVYANF
jgi:hypothetical protein